MKRVIFVIPIVLIFLVAACATMNVNVTPKQTSAMMNSVYSAQYAEYLTWFDIVGKDDQGKPIYKQKPGIPAKQIEVLQIKKKIFSELHPLLNAYANYAATGKAGKGIVISEVEARASALVQQLIMMDKEK